MVYKYKSVLTKLREVLLKYNKNMESMCDCCVCVLMNLIPSIELIVGEVHLDKKKISHVWAYDTKEKYYIDVTSEQFEFPKCLCSQDWTEFEKRGYVITNNFHSWNGAFKTCMEFNRQKPIFIHNGVNITLEEFIADVNKKKSKSLKRWIFFDGTRRKNRR